MAPHAKSFRIGVNWCGSETYRGNFARSMPHEMLLPLADIADVRLLSLHKGRRAEMLHADGSAAFILDVCSEDRDLADCAALMDRLDLIVTTDTVTAHLAGSLGRPCWLLLHSDPFWLWSHSGDDTPWYPSLRIFRQETAGDWDRVMENVFTALAERIGSRP